MKKVSIKFYEFFCKLFKKKEKSKEKTKEKLKEKSDKQMVKEACYRLSKKQKYFTSNLIYQHCDSGISIDKVYKCVYKLKKKGFLVLQKKEKGIQGITHVNKYKIKRQNEIQL
jgi:hypothetical protein